MTCVVAHSAPTPTLPLKNQAPYLFVICITFAVGADLAPVGDALRHWLAWAPRRPKLLMRRRLPDYATGPTTGGGLLRFSPGGEIPTAPGHGSAENPCQWLGLPSLLFAAHRHSSPAAQGARRCWGDGLALAAAGGALPWPFRRPRKEIQGRPKSSATPRFYAPACRSPKRTRENGGQAAPIAPGGWLSWVAMRRGALAAGARDGGLGAPFADGRCCLAVGAGLGRHAGQPTGVLPYWRGLRLPSFFPAVRLVAAALAVTDVSRVTGGKVSQRVTGDGWRGVTDGSQVGDSTRPRWWAAS